MTAPPQRAPSRTDGVALCLLAFILMGSYSVARPASESLFLAAYGSAALPKVWIAVAVTMILVVSAYNALAARVAVNRIFVWTAFASGVGVIALIPALRADLPGAVFVLYVWKDVYIVLLVEMFWSMANLVFPLRTARWAYGIFCAAGSLGSVSGGLGVGKLAEHAGTLNVLWLVPVLLAFVAYGASRFARRAGVPEKPPREEQRLRDALRVIGGDKYLGWLVVLVAASQVAITLVDYLYNTAIVRAYPALDERTRIIGYVYAGIDSSAFVMQLSAGAVLRALGIGATLTAIPLLLGSAIAAFWAAPAFVTMAVAKIASKAFDYSLFRAAKELLYIPLGYREKTAGKGVVDMLAYRVAKAGASLMLLALPLALAPVSALTLALIGLWLAVTVIVARRFARRSGQEVR